MDEISQDESLLRRPSAWVPIAISLAALAFIVVYVAVAGISREPGADEGAPARIFQMLMLAQLPIIAWFALSCLPKRPKQALVILALQAAAWLTPVITILWLENLI